MYPIDLSGKHAVVMGVANHRSLSWAIAQQLHKAGAALCLTYQGERLKSMVEELAATAPGALVLECDVTRVVSFMLDDARREILHSKLDGFAVAIQRRYRDLGKAGHHTSDVRDAQATLPPLFLGRAGREDFRIDDDGRLAFRTGVILEQCDEQSQTFVHLRRCQADPVILVHRVDHVVDQLLHQRIA